MRVPGVPAPGAAAAECCSPRYLGAGTSTIERGRRGRRASTAPPRRRPRLQRHRRSTVETAEKRSSGGSAERQSSPRRNVQLKTECLRMQQDRTRKMRNKRIANRGIAEMHLAREREDVTHRSSGDRNGERTESRARMTRPVDRCTKSRNGSACK